MPAWLSTTLTAMRGVLVIVCPALSWVMACTRVHDPGAANQSSSQTSVERPALTQPPMADSPPDSQRPAPALEAQALGCDGAALAEVLGALHRTELEPLADSDVGVSTRLLARWELERSLEPDGTLTPSAIDAFVTAVSAELRREPPHWWVEHLRSGKRLPSDEQRVAYDSRGTQTADRRGPLVAGPGDTQVRPEAARVLGAQAGKLTFDLSMGRVELGPMPSGSGIVIEYARARAGSTLYYAAFERGAGGFRFPLWAVGSDGQLRWEAEVCGPDRQILGGLGHLTTEIVVLEPPADPSESGMKLPTGAPIGIAVFTAESHGVALDVFDPDDGTRTISWSSDLWFAR